MHDVIVIGLGAMGSATCHHLAQRGYDVLGLEQFELGHARGSSHGQTRIIRQAYFEHPDYVPLLKLSYDLWRALETSSGRDLMNLCGLVMAGREDDEVITGTRKAALAHGLPLETLSRAPARDRFPGLRLDSEMTVLFDPLGGYLRVEECVLAHLEQAARLGATLRAGCPVDSWTSSEDGVRVVARGEEYRAKRLAITAGAWSKALLDALGLPLTVHRLVTAWFPSENRAHNLDQGAPVFAMQTAEGFFYGFPALDDRGVKIAGHDPGPAIGQPSDMDRTVSAGDIAPIGAFADRYVPGVNVSDWTANTCLYTMTPDCHFIVDVHPFHDNVCFAAGFSGHGFKFSAAIGKILADYCARGCTDEPAAFLGLSRFG